MEIRIPSGEYCYLASKEDWTPIASCLFLQDNSKNKKCIIHGEYLLYNYSKVAKCDQCKNKEEVEVMYDENV